VDGAAYLNGLAEAATELRRFILDLLRREDGDTPEAAAEAERLLAWMDAIYDHLVTFDFPDAITGDLRRRTDAVRGVLERTRGDLTTTLQQQRLQIVIENLAVHLLNHEHVAGESHEAEVVHLSSELGWSPAHAQRIVRLATRAGLVEQRAGALTLTEAGRALAQRALGRATASQS